MENLGLLLGFSGESISYLENSDRCKSVSFLLKSLVLGLDVAAESFQLYSANADYQKFNENATSIVTYENETRVSNVSLNHFNFSFFVYIWLFACNLLMCVAYGIYEWIKWERALTFISVMRILFLEMPLLTTEVFMLQSQTIVDWSTQNSFLATHCMFIVSIIVSTYFDIIIKLGMFKSKIWNIFTAAPMGYLLACMAYAPVSIAMFGVTVGKVAVVDFNGIVPGEFHKKVLSILMYVGRSGQAVWIGVPPVLSIYFFIIKMRLKQI